MAIDPELQWMLQYKYIKPTVGVLTNTRADHLDVMGPTVEDAASAMASILPDGTNGNNSDENKAICFTAEKNMFPLLNRIAKKIECSLVLTDAHSVSNEDMAGFSYIEHPENVALVLAVAQHFGIERDIALEGMWSATPDPGVLKIYNVAYKNQNIRFANAFAANDPDSTMKIWNMLKTQITSDETTIVVANSRADRIQRAGQLGKLMARIPAEGYILVGGLIKAIAEQMDKENVPQHKIFMISDGSPQKLFKRVLEISNNNSFILGIGNIGGSGHDIADFFEYAEKFGVDSVL